MHPLTQAFTDWLGGRLRERGTRHLDAAVAAVEDGDGVTLVIRIPRGNTATVDITAYPAKAAVLVDSAPIT